MTQNCQLILNASIQEKAAQQGASANLKRLRVLSSELSRYASIPERQSNIALFLYCSLTLSVALTGCKPVPVPSHAAVRSGKPPDRTDSANGLEVHAYDGKISQNQVRKGF